VQSELDPTHTGIQTKCRDKCTSDLFKSSFLMQLCFSLSCLMMCLKTKASCKCILANSVSVNFFYLFHSLEVVKPFSGYVLGLGAWVHVVCDRVVSYYFCFFSSLVYPCSVCSCFFSHVVIVPV
jgi:hypothetical protein